MGLFKKDLKIERIKKEAAQKERDRADAHYLDAINNLRIQHERTINKLTRSLKQEHRLELKQQQSLNKKINKLEEKIIEKDIQLKNNKKAWSMIGQYISDMMNLSSRIRMQTELQLKPAIEEFQRVGRNENECVMLLKKLDSETPKIEKLLGLGYHANNKKDVS